MYNFEGLEVCLQMVLSEKLPHFQSQQRSTCAFPWRQNPGKFRVGCPVSPGPAAGGAGGAVGHAFHLPVIVRRGISLRSRGTWEQKVWCLLPRGFPEVPCWDFARTLGHHPLAQWQGRSFHCGNQKLVIFRSGGLESDPWAHVSALPTSAVCL